MEEPAIGKDYYDRSGYFDRGTGHLTDVESAFQKYRIAKVLGIYRPSRDDRVLDLGCGWGTFEFALAPHVREIIGLDFSDRSIQLCEERLAREPRDNVSFVCADARHTGLEGESFDVIIAADLLEHLYPDDSEQVIREARRLLKPGGRLSIWTPNRDHFLEILRNRTFLLKRDITHVDYKSMERIRESLKVNGFMIEKAYYVESHLPVLQSIERTLLSVAPLMRRRIAVLARKR